MMNIASYAVQLAAFWMAATHAATFQTYQGPLKYLEWESGTPVLKDASTTIWDVNERVENAPSGDNFSFIKRGSDYLLYCDGVQTYDTGLREWKTKPAHFRLSSQSYTGCTSVQFQRLSPSHAGGRMWSNEKCIRPNSQGGIGPGKCDWLVWLCYSHKISVWFTANLHCKPLMIVQVYCFKIYMKRQQFSNQLSILYCTERWQNGDKSHSHLLQHAVNALSENCILHSNHSWKLLINFFKFFKNSVCYRASHTFTEKPF